MLILVNTDACHVCRFVIHIFQHVPASRSVWRFITQSAQGTVSGPHWHVYTHHYNASLIKRRIIHFSDLLKSKKWEVRNFPGISGHSIPGKRDFSQFSEMSREIPGRNKHNYNWEVIQAFGARHQLTNIAASSWGEPCHAVTIRFIFAISLLCHIGLWRWWFFRVSHYTDCQPRLKLICFASLGFFSQGSVVCNTGLFLAPTLCQSEGTER